MIKKLLILLLFLSGLVFADNDFVGAGAGAVDSPHKIIQPSNSMNVKYYSYHYKLPLDKLNKILSDNKIHTISGNKGNIYQSEIVGGNLTNIDKSFSKNFDATNSGYSICIIEGQFCQFSSGVTTDSGLSLNTAVSFFMHFSKNTIFTNVEVFDNSESSTKPTKFTARLDNISDKSYIIIYNQKWGDLSMGQIMLVQFGKYVSKD